MVVARYVEHDFGHLKSTIPIVGVVHSTTMKRRATEMSSQTGESNDQEDQKPAAF